MQDIESNQERLEAKEVIQKVMLIKKKVEEVPVNEIQMNALVDYMFTLAKIMDNLSDLKDYAYIQSEALEEEYKTAVRDKYIELKDGMSKMTDTMAKSLAEQSCDDIKGNVLKAEHQARWLKSLYDDCDRLISFSQTKVKSHVDSFVRSNIDRK